MIGVIRLQKIKGHKEYRIIITDKQKHPKSGKVIAILGYYNPHTKQTTFNINQFIL